MAGSGELSVRSRGRWISERTQNAGRSSTGFHRDIQGDGRGRGARGGHEEEHRPRGEGRSGADEQTGQKGALGGERIPQRHGLRVAGIQAAAGVEVRVEPVEILLGHEPDDARAHQGGGAPTEYPIRDLAQLWRPRRGLGRRDGALLREPVGGWDVEVPRGRGGVRNIGAVHEGPGRRALRARHDERRGRLARGDEVDERGERRREGFRVLNLEAALPELLAALDVEHGGREPLGSLAAGALQAHDDDFLHAERTAHPDGVAHRALGGSGRGGKAGKGAAGDRALIGQVDEDGRVRALHLEPPWEADGLVLHDGEFIFPGQDLPCERGLSGLVAVEVNLGGGQGGLHRELYLPGAGQLSAHLLEGLPEGRGIEPRVELVLGIEPQDGPEGRIAVLPLSRRPGVEGVEELRMGMELPARVSHGKAGELPEHIADELFGLRVARLVELILRGLELALKVLVAPGRGREEVLAEGGRAQHRLLWPSREGVMNRLGLGVQFRVLALPAGHHQPPGSRMRDTGENANE
ncbi:hypothetical protein STIAU_1630 [Stigmatella aurantiaca DW4/3-1]|uniref:Uncharacterized protein n=1 Tax=Stigmatella aurantiaca (strain DW4/3-1) TaxID=378806 RepID=Q08RZ6_STIAD|nr:hypothetical protein STIAU_1630 [Stigmatella aurantiaca DW4/3-1]